MALSSSLSPREEANPPDLNEQQLTTLLVSVFIIAICGLVYELIVGTLSSYLLGNSVAHFSLTIGLFLSAMGIGSLLSRFVRRRVLRWFIIVEITIGVVGGSGAALLYAVFATSNLYYPAMAGLILITGGCIGLEIPLLTRLGQGSRSVRETLANVLAFDYLGALIGSIAFPIILLPQLGLLRTSFLIGLLNLAVAGFLIVTFRKRLRRWWGLATAVGLSALLLAAGAIWAFNLTSWFERQLYTDEIIYASQTPYQRIVMTRWREDVRLYLDGNLQFSLVDEYRYHEPLVHPAMSLSASRSSVLVLGGGDGLALREILKYPDVERVVLVDIDPEMTRLAQTHLTLRSANQDALADPRVELVHEDAFNYVAQGSERFGVIIADLPDPNNESLSKLYTRSFYQLIDKRLAAGGLFVTQATSPYFARDAFWGIEVTLANVFSHTLPYHVQVPSFGEWGFVLAGQTNSRPERYAPTVELRFLSPEAFARSQAFDTDTAAVPVEVNTLDDPILLTYYQRSWKQWR